MWNIIIDALFVLIILVCIGVGIGRGFIDSVLGLVSTGVALLVSIFTAKYLANFINKIFNFEDMILRGLDKANDGNVTFFGGKVSLSNVEVAKFVVWIISLVMIFLLIKLVVFILAKIFEKVTKKSPTISGINRVLGMIFGALRGGVIVVIILALCSLLSQVPIIGQPIYDTVSKPTITGAVFKYVDEFVEDKFDQKKVEDIISRIVSDNKAPEEGSGQ